MSAINENKFSITFLLEDPLKQFNLSVYCLEGGAQWDFIVTVVGFSRQ